MECLFHLFINFAVFLQNIPFFLDNINIVFMLLELQE